MSKLKLEGELSLDGRGWENTLNKAGASIDKLTVGISGGLKNALAAAFAVGIAEETIRRTVDYVTHIKDLSEQTSISTDEVQRLGYAAKSTGLQFEDFQTALSKLGSARKDAAEKNDDLVRTFQKFGVTLEDLQNPALRNVDLLKRMAEAIKGVDLNAEDRQSLREFFGKSGDKLAQAIASLDNFKDRPIVSKQDIEAIDQLDKSIDRLKTAAMVSLAPVIANVSNAASGMLNVRSNEEFLIQAGQYFKAQGNKEGSQLVKNYFDALKYNISDEQIALEKERLIQELAKTAGNKQMSKDHWGEMVSNPYKAVPVKAAVAEVATANKESLFTDQRKVELAKQQAELNDLAYKNAFNLMSVDQKRAELVKEINRLLHDSNAVRSANPAAAFDLRIEREKKIAELQGLPHPTRPTDSLLQIGGVLGDTAKAVPQIQQKLVDAQEKSIAAMADLTAALKFIGQKIGGVGGANPFSSLGIP